MDCDWQRLFSDRVYALDGPIADHLDALPAEEAALTESMAPARRAEFATGRTLARRALRAIGASAGPLLRGAGGAPRWPSGVKGSITHVRDEGIAYCAVAVSTDLSIAGVGLDAERRQPLPAGVRSRVLSDGEREMVARLPAGLAIWADRLVFSAKECVYKTLYPAYGRFLEFHDVEVRLDADRSAFTACIRPETRTEGPLGAMCGRFLAGSELIVTAMELDRVHIPDSVI